MGHGIVLAYIAIGWLSSALYLILLKRENRKRGQGLRNEVIDGVYDEYAQEKNGHFTTVEEAMNEKGDEWSGFKYSL